MKKKLVVRGHYRRMKGGRYAHVGSHTATRIVVEHTVVDVDYSGLRDSLKPDTVTEWKSTRKIPKSSFWKKLTRQDSYIAKDILNGIERKAFVDIDPNGEGTLKIRYNKDLAEKDPNGVAAPKQIAIGPYADLTSLGAHASITNLLYPESAKHFWDLHSVNLEGCKAEGACLRNINFSEANLASGNFEKADLKGSVLKKAFLNQSNLKDCNLSYANLSGADLSDSDITGADLSGANLTGVNWRGVKMQNTTLTLDPSEYNTLTTYDQYNFHDAAEVMGISESQMEFLIISQAVEVRDNSTSEIVTRNFDAKKHHVVPWDVQNFVKSDSDDETS